MIRILDPDIANKIAAGEVITGPSAVVKELVENAIDAGADRITIEIRAGGKDYIRVSDNGSGIPADEVELAFEKHATGKIVTEEDLENIGTLGFRGEALGSIATVSDLEMITRTADETAGVRLLMEQGKVTEKKAIGCEQGTTITVMRLFYNTPARLKFMKSDRAEAALVSDFLSKAAIAYPEIKFKFISNDRILFNTRGQGDGLAAILTVYGGSLSGKLIPVEAESPDGTLSMRAYMADPMENRPSRKMQIFFVNGRLVHDKTIEDAVAAAYKGRMFAGRYPVIFLFLETTPDKLDVNIHPSKDRIRFYDTEKTGAFIRENLLKGLATKDLVPHLNVRGEDPFFSDAEEPIIKETIKSAETGAVKPAAEAPDKEWSQSEKPLKSTISGLSKGNAGSVGTEVPFGRASVQEEVDVKAMLTALRKEKETSEESSAAAVIKPAAPLDRPFDFSSLIPMGILFDTYIAAKDDNSLYLIDQHAAHERVLFEQIMKNFRERAGESQMLLVPATFETAAGDTGWLEGLEKIGFEIEDFGPGTYKIRAVPLSFTDIDVQRFLGDYVLEYEKGDLVGEDLYDRIATMACKAAVKAHDKLKDEEVAALLQDLAKCVNPFACPHGRPTFLRMSQSEIERDFKRK